MSYKWGISVSLPKNRYNEGTLTFSAYEEIGGNRIPKFIRSCVCRGQGNYTVAPKSIPWNEINGDTPTGTSYGYTIMPGNKPEMYGPNKRIDISTKSISGNMYEAVHTYGRADLQIHGGRDGGAGTKLWNTSGCLRVHDQDIKAMTEYIDQYCEREGFISISEN